MDIRTLENTDLHIIYDAFIDSFSDYQVPMSISYDTFIKMLKRRSFDAHVSCGVFEGNRLIAFVLNAQGLWNEKRCFYDLGTGVIKEYRKRGLAKRLLRYVKGLMKDHNISIYLLEVLESNSAAYKLYLSEGFNESRRLKCYQGHIKASFNDTVSVESFEDKHRILPCHDEYASWQNSTLSISKVKEDYKVFSICDQKNYLAYAFVNPNTGDIAQLHVCDGDPSLISKLLYHIQYELGDLDLSFVNVDEHNSTLIQKLKTLNFKNTIDQYEMIYSLEC